MQPFKKMPFLLSLLIAFITITISWNKKISPQETIIRMVYLVPVFYLAGLILHNNIIEILDSEKQLDLEAEQQQEDVEDLYKSDITLKAEDENSNEFKPIDFRNA